MSQPIGFNDLFNLGDFEQGTQKLAKVISAITDEIDKAKNNANQLSKALGASLKAEINALTASSDKLEKDLEAMNKKMADFKNTTAQTTSVIDKYEKEVEKLKTELEKLKKAQEDETKATQNSNAVKGQASKISGQLAQSFLGVASGAALVYRGVQILANQLKLAVDSMLEFEQAMKEVQAITRASSQELEQLTENANRLGATTEKTAGQIATLQKELGKLGFNTTEILASTDAIVDLSTATGEDLAGSATVAAATLRAFNLEATEMNRVVDVMTGSFVRSGLDLEKFRESMKLVAPIAAATGVEIEVTTAALSKLADAGLSGSLAGTALRNLLSSLADPTEKLTKFIGSLNSELADGVKSSDDLILAFKELKNSGLQLADAVQMVDVRARPAFFTLLNQADAVEGLTLEYQDLEGEAARIASMMRDTLSNDIKIADSAFDAFRRNLVEQFTPAMREAVQATTLISEALRFLVSDIAEATSNMSDNEQALVDWISGASAARAIFGGLVDVIKEYVKVSQFEELGKNLEAREQSVKQAAVAARKEILVYEALKKSFDEGKDYKGVKTALVSLGEEYDYLLNKITEGGEDEQKVAKRLFIQLEKNLQSRKGTIQQQQIALTQAQGQLKALELAGVHTGKLGEDEVAKARMLEEQIDSLQGMVDEYSSLESKLVSLLAKEKVLRDYDIDSLNSKKEENKALEEKIKLENQLSEATLKREVEVLSMQAKIEQDPIKKLAVQEELYMKQTELVKLRYQNELRLLNEVHSQDENILLKRKLAYQNYLSELDKAGDKFLLEQFGFMEDATRGLEKAVEEAKKRSNEALKRLAKERTEDAKKRAKEEVQAEEDKVRRIKELAQQAGQGLSQITRFVYDNRAMSRANELAEIEAWEQARLEMAGDNEEAKAQIEKEAEKKRAAIRRKQAKDDRNEALFQIAIQTAVNVVQAFPDPLKMILAGALGVAQAAIVAARPLPEFAKGTDSSPEGYAIVGEKGSELIRDGKTGKVRLSADRPSVEYLSKNSVVVPADQTKALLANPHFDHNGTAERYLGSSRSVQQKSDFSYERLEQVMVKAVSNIPVNQTNFDEKGVAKYTSNRISKIKRLNKRY